jgi:outer membrane protein assembly factor BamB
MVDILNPFLFSFKTNFGIFSKPAIGEKEVYFTTKTGLLYSINRFNGKPLWRYQINSTGETSPIVIKENSSQNELIFVGGVYSFYNNLSLASVTQPIKLWYNDIISTRSKTPCIVCSKTNNYLFIGTEHGNIAELNCTNGSIIWSKELSGIDTSHIIHNKGRIFVGTQSSDKKIVSKKKGYIYSLNSTNGDIIWKFSPAPLSSFLSIHSPVFVFNGLNHLINNKIEINNKGLILAGKNYYIIFKIYLLINLLNDIFFIKKRV